jgi:hypothetical protein
LPHPVVHPAVELLLLSKDREGDLRQDDAWRVLEGDPEQVLREYQYRHPWEETREIEGHKYRSISDPEFEPEPNTHFGGTVYLDDHEFLFPFRAGVGTVTDVLQDQAEESDAVFIDYRPQYLELAPSDGLEKYRLLPKLRGDNRVTGTQIVDEVQVRERGSENLYQSFEIDELASDYFEEQLLELGGVSRKVAEVLLDRYTNLRTFSWAITSDTEYLETEHGLDAKELFREVGGVGIYMNDDSLDAGILKPPEELLEDEAEDEGEAEEDDTSQTGLADF